MSIEAAKSSNNSQPHVPLVLCVFGSLVVGILCLALAQPLFFSFTERNLREAVLENCFIDSYPLVDCEFSAAGDLPVEYVEPVNVAKAVEFVAGSRTPQMTSPPSADTGNCLVARGAAYCFAEDAQFHLPPVRSRGGWKNAVSFEIDTVMSTFPGYHTDPAKGVWRVPY